MHTLQVVVGGLAVAVSIGLVGWGIAGAYRWRGADGLIFLAFTVLWAVILCCAAAVNFWRAAIS